MAVPNTNPFIENHPHIRLRMCGKRLQIQEFTRIKIIDFYPGKVKDIVSMNDNLSFACYSNN